MCIRVSPTWQVGRQQAEHLGDVGVARQVAAALEAAGARVQHQPRQRARRVARVCDRTPYMPLHTVAVQKRLPIKTII